MRGGMRARRGAAGARAGWECDQGRPPSTWRAAHPSDATCRRWRVALGGQLWGNGAWERACAWCECQRRVRLRPRMRGSLPPPAPRQPGALLGVCTMACQAPRVCRQGTSTRASVEANTHVAACMAESCGCRLSAVLSPTSSRRPHTLKPEEPRLELARRCARGIAGVAARSGWWRALGQRGCADDAACKGLDCLHAP